MNPRSGRREKSGRRSHAQHPSRASKRRRRNVLAGAPGQARAIEHAAGDRTSGKRRRFARIVAIASSHTLQEHRSPREDGSHRKPRELPPRRNTSKRDAGFTRRNRTEGSLKPYGDTFGGQNSGGQTTPREEDVAVETPQRQPGATTISKRFGTDSTRRHALKRTTGQKL